MHAEPDPVPTEAGGKFPIDFGGLGLGSGCNTAGGQPQGLLPSLHWESHLDLLLSQGPVGPCR